MKSQNQTKREGNDGGGLDRGYRNHLRMDNPHFKGILEKSAGKIKKKNDSNMREALPARLTLQIKYRRTHNLPISQSFYFRRIDSLLRIFTIFTFWSSVSFGRETNRPTSNWIYNRDFQNVKHFQTIDFYIFAIIITEHTWSGSKMLFVELPKARLIRTRMDDTWEFQLEMKTLWIVFEKWLMCFGRYSRMNCPCIRWIKYLIKFTSRTTFPITRGTQQKWNWYYGISLNTLSTDDRKKSSLNLGHWR